MIIFDLLCGCGCQFEGWFNGQQEYLEQQEKKMLTCPSCGGDQVHKILSPVALHTAGSCEQKPRRHETVAVPFSEQEIAARLLQALQGYVLDNFEDVGSKLGEESLKMHYGVIAPRNIRGVVTCEEEKMLQKEGVELLQIPFPVNDEDVH